MKSAALIGDVGAGKTTFACMCHNPNEGIIADGFTDYFEEVKKEFLFGKLPGALEKGGTPRPEWDFITIRRETFFRKWQISIVDCSGEIQIEVLKELDEISKEWRAGNREIVNPFLEILNKILDKETEKLKEYVWKNMWKPIPEWGKRLKEERGSEGYIPRNRDANIPKILFLITLMNADRFIFAVDGGVLKMLWEEMDKLRRKGIRKGDVQFGILKEIEDSRLNKLKLAYDLMKYYRSILYLKRIIGRLSRCVLMITKSYKFGDNKREALDMLNIFLSKTGFKEELRFVRWKSCCVGVRGKEGKENEEHTGKVYGVEEVISSIFPLI